MWICVGPRGPSTKPSRGWLCMAGIPIFSQGGHEKLTPPQKIALTRENKKNTLKAQKHPQKAQNTPKKHKNTPQKAQKHQKSPNFFFSRLRAKKKPRLFFALTREK